MSTTINELLSSAKENTEVPATTTNKEASTGGIIRNVYKATIETVSTTVEIGYELTEVVNEGVSVVKPKGIIQAAKDIYHISSGIVLQIGMDLTPLSNEEIIEISKGLKELTVKQRAEFFISLGKESTKRLSKAMATL
jgi:hypothetical protein